MATWLSHIATNLWTKVCYITTLHNFPIVITPFLFLEPWKDTVYMTSLLHTLTLSLLIQPHKGEPSFLCWLQLLLLPFATFHYRTTCSCVSITFDIRVCPKPASLTSSHPQILPYKYWTRLRKPVPIHHSSTTPPPHYHTTSHFLPFSVTNTTSVTSIVSTGGQQLTARLARIQYQELASP